MLIRSSIFILLLSVTCGKCEKSNWSTGVRLLMKLYDGCQKRDFLSCVKIKAINFFDRIDRSKEITLDDNLSIVRDEMISPRENAVSDTELAGNLARGQTDDSKLDEILLRKVADFFNTHKIVFNLPKIEPRDIQEEVEEGRGKMKKMMSMMMMGLAMKKAAAIPMAFGMLFLLAGKALIISKLALVLTLIVALKKLKSSSK